jgi:hypothetical protein
MPQRWPAIAVEVTYEGGSAMDDVITVVSHRTGLSEGDSVRVLETVIGYIQHKLAVERNQQLGFVNRPMREAPTPAFASRR